MFLLPPPQTSDFGSTVVTYFGDPAKLKEGLLVRDRDNAKGKRIYSVYDLELGVKYTSDHGFTLKRISENECLVKRRTMPALDRPDGVRQSSPISIPSSYSSSGPKMARTIESSSSSRSDPESDDRVKQLAESFDKAGSAPKGLSPFEDMTKHSPFEELDFPAQARAAAAAAAVDADDDHDADSDAVVRIGALPTPYIPGETIEGRFDDVEYVSTAGSGAQPANRDAKYTSGALYITNYQLIFVPYEHHRVRRIDSSDSLLTRRSGDRSRPRHEKPVSIPLAAIARFEKVDRQNAHFMFGGDTSYSIDIFAKDCRRTMRFALNPSKHSRPAVCDLLRTHVFPTDLKNVFAVSQNGRRQAAANAGDATNGHSRYHEHPVVSPRGSAGSAGRAALSPASNGTLLTNGSSSIESILEYGHRLSYHGSGGFSSLDPSMLTSPGSGPSKSVAAAAAGPVGPSNAVSATLAGAVSLNGSYPGGQHAARGAETEGGSQPNGSHHPAAAPTGGGSLGGALQGVGAGPSGRAMISSSATSIDFQQQRPSSEPSGSGSRHMRSASTDSVFLASCAPTPSAHPGPPASAAANNVLVPAPSASGAPLDDGPIQGWSFYSAEEEYGRMGVGDSRCPWRFSQVNAGYKLCKSYPQTFVVPAGITDDELLEISPFRSKERIPVLSWRNVNTGVSLSRCSQPKTGISRSFRCRADERLVSEIQKTNPYSREIHIMDARPMANAMANMAMGGGYENLNFYPECELEWMGIANIHVVRDSYNKLREACENYTAASHADYDPLKPGTGWLSALENTHWLENLSSILGGVVRVVDLLEKKRKSVLVHCSDGWDRTPQVCSLVQLFIDPHYRTLRGFCALVEKEWLQFGHKFADRLGFNFEDGCFKEAERSPIFLQFLDCAYQALVQFPQKFEFSEQLLLTIVEHAHSGRFGTFLKNDHRERFEARLHELSPSLWSYVLNNPAPYLNPFYQADSHPSGNVIVPLCDIKNLQLWRSLYLRHLTDHAAEFENQHLRLGTELRRQVVSLEAEAAALRRRNAELESQLHRLQAQQLALASVSVSRSTSRSGGDQANGSIDYDHQATANGSSGAPRPSDLTESDFVSLEDDAKDAHRPESPPATRVWTIDSKLPG